MKRRHKRQHILKVATELFNRYGYHAVGVDRIIAEAEVAKTTLYRHYPTKTELIVAVLSRLGESFRRTTREKVDSLAPKSSEKLLIFFDVLAQWFGDESFYGCPFLSAASEFGDRESLVFQEVVLHKRLMLAYFEELARGAKLDLPERVAGEISLLYEGAINMARISGSTAPALQAQDMARRTIKRYSPGNRD